MFQYHIAHFSINEINQKEVIEELNKLGNQRWELISVQRVMLHSIEWNEYVFKRGGYKF